MHVTLYEVSGESQFSDSVWWLYDFANLLCKTVKCHEGSFLKNKISFAEEVIGNIIKSWKPHIDFVSKKISKSVGIIAKARFYLSSQTLMTLYYSHVYPFLTYCNVAWSSTYRSSVNCIYLLPKRLRGSILLPPRHPSVFARMARWQQVLAFTLFVRNSSRHVYDDRIHTFNYSTYCLCPIRIATHGSTSLLNES